MALTNSQSRHNDRDGLNINLFTEGNRVWAEYLVCRAEDIATWDTVPTKDRRHYLSLAKKIQDALETVGLECRRWWEAPRNLDEWWQGMETKNLTNQTVGGLKQPPI